MIHPYASRTRSRDRRPAEPASEGSSIVGWIVAAGFIFILLYAFVAPIVEHAR